MSSTSPTEEILVLYASQTGNSEQAAIDVSDQIPSRLGSQFSSRHMQLDDFLELEKAKWTRVVVIITSSYGVGAAPLGGYRFRAFCDEILEKENDLKGLLDGITFCLLGLGDSGYTTFFENPTAFNKSMHAAGAVRVGDLGKADAAGEGKDEQGEVIQRWKDGIWEHLKKAVKQEAVGADRLEEIQTETLKITETLLGSDEDDSSSSTSSSDQTFKLILATLLVALIAVLVRIATK